MYILKSCIFILLSLPMLAQAQDYQVKLHVKNLPADAQPVLLRVYNGDVFMLDSVAKRDRDVISFNIPQNTTPGTLKCLLGMSPYSQFIQRKPIDINFLFNKENVELSLVYNFGADSVKVIQSKENQIYFDFQKEDALLFRKLSLLEQVVINYPAQDEFYQKALEYYKKFQLQRDKFIDKLYSANKQTLAGRIIRNQKVPITEGNLTPIQRDSIFKQDFLRKIDFNDTLLLYTTVYSDKAYQYIQMSMKRDASPRENEANCIAAIDRLVPYLDVNPVVQQHILQFLIAGFEAMKMEEVLAHISSNYLQQCGGSGEIIKQRLEGYSKMAIGQNVSDFTTYDLNGQAVNLYNDINPYTLLIFWHTTCDHCKILMEELPKLSQQGLFSKHQIKIIGISIDEEKENWEKFSKDYRLDWINTHADGSFESAIANDYNLFATPSMFLLDENHKILAKPTTIEELVKNVKEIK